jgi:arylsulfatase
MRYSFDDADAPTPRETQYYEMVGTRGIWHKGWKAATVHGPMPSNIGHYAQDQWQLFHTDEDRAEAIDLAQENPQKLKEMIDLWEEEATKYNVFPLTDVSSMEIHELEYHVAAPKTGRYVYYPGTTEIPEASAARTLGSSFKILAEVEFTGDTQGIIVSQGSRFGGYTLFVKGGKLVWVYNFLGIPPEQRLSTAAPTSGTHVVGVEFKKEKNGEYGEGLGTMTLYIDDEAVASGDCRTQSGHYALCGEGLAIGYDSGDAVSADYTPRFEFSGGNIMQVVYDVADDVYLDQERLLAAALARD